MRFLTLLCCCFSSLFLFAQDEINYIAPPTLEIEDCALSLKDIIAKEDYCKFRLTIKNNSDTYYAYNTQKVGFNYDNAGTYKPKKGKFKVIKPKGQIAFVPRVDGNFDFRRNSFKLDLNGLHQATTTDVLSLEALPLKTGAMVQVNDLTATVKKATFKKGKLNFTLIVDYKGTAQTLVQLTTKTLTTTDGDAIRFNGKEIQLLQQGNKVTLVGSMETPSEEVALSFGENLSRYSFTPIEIPSTPIYQEGSLVQQQPANPTVTTTTEGNKTMPAASNTYAVSSCTPVNVAGTRRAQLNFFNADRKCFVIYVNGALISQQYTSNITFTTGSGKQTLEIHFQDGQIFKDNVFIHGSTLAVSFEIKPKKESFKVVKKLNTIESDPDYVSPLDQRFGNDNKTASGNDSGGFQMTTKSSSSSTTTVNGKTTSSSSKSSSSTIRVK
ncbi:MAG: hypothetical protein ACRBFS_01445 [Aureispira sp.]